MPAQSAQARPRVCFVTLGCAKNEVDSANMKRRVLAAGFCLEEDPAQADAVVVNTCSFIQAATEESLEAIFEIAGLENFERGDAKLVVAGCMPARYGDDLAAELTEASEFVPCSKEDDIAAILCKILPDAEGAVHDTALAADAEPVRDIDGQPSAYVKISDGCDRFCSYCTIPFIRGRYRSFAREEILAEVARQVSAGTREIVFIAQDTGRWGDDFEEPSTLASLLADAAEAFPHTWFRVMYIQPEGVTDELLSCVADHENIASYFDIPLQHADADILRAMNRRGSREEYEALVARIRQMVPGAMVRTTLIAGFPGETEEQFETLCDFVEEADLDYVGVFPYSQEDGTRAARMDGQIDDDVKQERAQTLRDLADASSTARVAQRVGQEMDVLVLGREEDGQLYGRARCQAPDVDGVVYLDGGNPGDVVRVRIVDTLLYEMEGELL